MNGMIRRGPDLGRVCIPLVRLMNKEGLSWSDRELIAGVILDTLRVHADMQAEAEHLAGGANACGPAAVNKQSYERRPA